MSAYENRVGYFLIRLHVETLIIQLLVTQIIFASTDSLNSEKICMYSLNIQLQNFYNLNKAHETRDSLSSSIVRTLSRSSHFVAITLEVYTAAENRKKTRTHLI